jgi:hypothetical protein
VGSVTPQRTPPKTEHRRSFGATQTKAMAGYARMHVKGSQKVARALPMTPDAEANQLEVASGSGVDRQAPFAPRSSRICCTMRSHALSAGVAP